MSLTQQNFDSFVEAAIEKANIATKLKYNEDMGRMIDACGFAWVSIWIDGRSKLGRIVNNNQHFAASYRAKEYTLWAGGEAGRTQNMCIKEYWARVIADHLKENGIDASVGSRMD